jgi:Secretion system C-terminal sorting domain
MSKDLRIFLAIAFNLGLLISANGQTDRFAYAVTDAKKEGSSWTVLRKLDTKTGEFSNVLLDGTNQSAMLSDLHYGNNYSGYIKDTSNLYLPELPFGSGVAAIAYDRKNNRLFFTPMYIDQLRYIDLESMKVVGITERGFIGAAASKSEPGNTLSRMVIAGDGYGYIISNDGNHMYRFSTSGTPVISDMGSLKDYPGNNEMTIHNACGNAGGDMIADDEGNVFLITAQNSVYKITVSSMVAKFLGKISGLPEKFTANGAAVDDEGKVIVSSSLYGEGYFSVDPLTWKASAYKTKNGIYKSADLANSNILVTRKPSTNNTSSVINLGNGGLIKLYPNPAENNLFMVRFTNLEPGEYSLQLTDILGRNLLQRTISIKSGVHTETIKMPPKSSVGIFMVKIINEKNKQVFSEKLLVNQMQ